MKGYLWSFLILPLIISCGAKVDDLDFDLNPTSEKEVEEIPKITTVGSLDVTFGGGDGLGLGGGVSCVGRFGGRGGGAGRDDEPPANVLSYSALLAGSLRTSHASFSSLVVASALGLGFRSG